jgi:hypothetical protein
LVERFRSVIASIDYVPLGQEIILRFEQLTEQDRSMSSNASTVPMEMYVTFDMIEFLILAHHKSHVAGQIKTKMKKPTSTMTTMKHLPSHQKPFRKKR